jgi:hypothetical protein
MIAAPLMDVRTDPLNMGMGGVALMADAPSATIWGVIALPKRVVSVGVIDLIKYVPAQQVAQTCPKRMEFARHMTIVSVHMHSHTIVYFYIHTSENLVNVGSSRHKLPQHLQFCVSDTDPSGQN